MAKLKFVFVLFVALVPFSISGCGSSSEPTVVEADPSAEVDNEEYDNETMGNAASDESQN